MMKFLCTTLIFGTFFVLYHAGTETSRRRLPLLCPSDVIGKNVFVRARDRGAAGGGVVFSARVIQTFSDGVDSGRLQIHHTIHKDWFVTGGKVHVYIPAVRGLRESRDMAVDTEDLLPEDTVREIAKKNALGGGRKEYSQDVIHEMAQLIFENFNTQEFTVNDYAKSEDAFNMLRYELNWKQYLKNLHRPKRINVQSVREYSKQHAMLVKNQDKNKAEDALEYCSNIIGKSDTDKGLMDENALEVLKVTLKRDQARYFYKIEAASGTKDAFIISNAYDKVISKCTSQIRKLQKARK